MLTTSYWPADASVPLDEVTVGELLRRVAGQVPDRVALVDGQAAAAGRRRWSYAELLAIAEDVAGALLARFEPGERVAVWEPPASRAAARSRPGTPSAAGGRTAT